jgi:hypothetical protein
MDFIAGSQSRDVGEQIACRGSQMWRRLWNGKLYWLSGTSLAFLAAFLRTVGSVERGSETRSECWAWLVYTGMTPYINILFDFKVSDK